VGAIFCGECGSSTRPRRQVTGAARTDTRELPLESMPGFELSAATHRESVPRFSDEPTVSNSVATNDVARELSDARGVLSTDAVGSFLLRFSNGTSVTVTSGGLLGRNPAGNSADADAHLIIVTDPDRTVSKTHLEFGIEAGDFWICDRFSGNGTTVQEPGHPPRRLIPGRRYRIFRGTVVGIGEQAFTLA